METVLNCFSARAIRPAGDDRSTGVSDESEFKLHHVVGLCSARPRSFAVADCSRRLAGGDRADARLAGRRGAGFGEPPGVVTDATNAPVGQATVEVKNLQIG